ncbi:Small auxin-up RNA [Dillenia turbinata]|uniref:Small auxin-up RNA n=1 Tax=Dillenia turbinata TaxID=194707 RepID=A0AAN8Z5F6_9MAGN
MISPKKLIKMARKWQKRAANNGRKRISFPRRESSQNVDDSSASSEKSRMISAKKLIKMARKWQKRAASSRKRISFPRRDSSQDLDERSTSSDISLSKGHFVVYTSDRRRFVLPLSYLNNYIFAELLRMSEEEFGLPSNEPITLPCDAVFMEYILLIIRRGISKDLAKALVSSAASCSVFSAMHQESSCSKLLVPVH